MAHRTFELVGMPGRRFTVGSPDPAFHAEPPHEVELDSFRIADRCVSAGDFHAFLRDAPGDIDHTMIDCIDPAFITNRGGAFELRPGCAEFPMIQINYWAAAAYCNWLSRLEGLRPVYALAERSADLGLDGYRLPTEAEWEAACRDGRPDGAPAPAPAPEECNSADAGPRCRSLRAGETLAGNFLPGTPGPVPVAALPADAAGLYQMLGNVREWCHDRFGPYGSPSEAPLRNPGGAARGTFRVVRGGSFVDPAEGLGPAARMAAHEETRCEVYGFRVVRRG